MNQIELALVGLDIINKGLVALAQLRRQGMTMAEIAAKLDAVDAGTSAPISLEDVVTVAGRAQQAIDDGRNMSSPEV